MFQRGYQKMSEARRMPGLSGEVLNAANEARRRRDQRLATEAAQEAMYASRKSRGLSQQLGGRALSSVHDTREDSDC